MLCASMSALRRASVSSRRLSTSVGPSRKRVLAKRLGGFVAFVSCGLGALYAIDQAKFQTGVRIARCLRVAVVMIADYSWVLRGDQPDPALVERAHQRNANRLRDLFFVNKGIYIKVGQYIGMMDHIVPDAYVASLSECFDRAPTSSFEDVECVLKEEFGKSSSELFADFQKDPVASASLAQVHVARSHQGEKLAIKIQHRHLAQGPTEIHAIDLILRCVRYLRPDFGFKQIIEEAKVNLPRELDFRQEAQNSKTCREILKPFGSLVVVPEVVQGLVSRRVLGMKFEEGLHLCDAGALQSLGIDTHTVVKLLTEIFCYMTFRHGVVHCDPHPANVLVRKDESTGRVQLVVLDHGLYRQVTPRTRLTYSRLWKAIVLGDVKGVEQASTDLGLVSPWMEKKHPGMTHTLIAAMLTGQEWTNIASEGGLGRMDNLSEQDSRAKLAKNVQEYFEGIRDVLDTCPRDLLLLLKTSDALRCCSNRLGGRTSDIFAITAKSCISALLEADVSADGISKQKTKWWPLPKAFERVSLLYAYTKVVLFIWWQDWASPVKAA